MDEQSQDYIDIAQSLRRGRAVEYAYEPGNMTRYNLVLVPLHAPLDRADSQLAQPTLAGVPLTDGSNDYEDGWIVLVWIGHGAMPIDVRSSRHVPQPSYISEKLGASCSLADAQALRALLTRVVPFPNMVTA